VFRTNVSYGKAADCFSRALCMPRGLFNIDLTGTGLRVRKVVSAYNYHNRLSNINIFIY
jgi:hypothetical protein